MITSELLNCSALSLPKQHWTGDFRRFLHDTFTEYLAALDQLGEQDHLASQIIAEQASADVLARWVEDAVREYFRGQTERAYAQLHKALNLAVLRIVNLFTDGPEQHATEPLYRMDKVIEQRLTRSSLFHCPFELRTKVGMRRYGVPGVPCLYLGGGIEIVPSRESHCRRRAAASCDRALCSAA